MAETKKSNFKKTANDQKGLDHGYSGSSHKQSEKGTAKAKALLDKKLAPVDPKGYIGGADSRP